MQLFTDGLTIWPTVPCLSLSTWAVVLAEPGKLEGTRVVNGVVLGDSQTNNRAELLAVLAAVLSGTGGCIYSDSLRFQGFVGCKRTVGRPFYGANMPILMYSSKHASLKDLRSAL